MREASPDPYRELGISRTADARGIRTAYLAKARLHHPDNGGTVRAMARVNAAYELLRAPVGRAAYDTPPEVGVEETRRPEHWTGAAGPPPGRPVGRVLDFGIFAGWSIGEIARRDPGYLEWLAERREGEPLREEIAAFVPVREHRDGGR